MTCELELYNEYDKFLMLRYVKIKSFFQQYNTILRVCWTLLRICSNLRFGQSVSLEREPGLVTGVNFSTHVQKSLLKALERVTTP